MPLISVIVPCYNQAQFLDECLQSVLDQTYQDWECIIVNDGSSDQTEQFAKKWVKKDKRFIYFYKENGGLSSARNFGLDRASGTWIQLLDCDDYLDPNKLEKQLSVLTEVSICDYRKVDMKKNILKDNYCKPFSENLFSYSDLILKWETELSIPCHCALFKKTDLRFNENLTNHEDWVFWLKLFYQREKVAYHKEVLAFYRINENSMSRNDVRMKEGFLKACDEMYVWYRKNNDKYNAKLVNEKKKKIINNNITYSFKEKIALKFSSIYKFYKNVKKN